MSRQVTHDGLGSLQIRFPYGRELVGLVKSLPGRRWNAAEKYWSVPEVGAVEVVDLLQPHGFSFDRATRELYGSLGGRIELPHSEPSSGPVLPGLFDDPIRPEPGEASADGTGDLTVSRLNERVRAAVHGAFPEPVWLVGEISGYTKNAHRRHVTFELVERQADGRSSAKISAVLFAATREAVDATLERAGRPFELEDELTVRLRVSVGLYVPWGQYRVVVEEIDPGYTLGEAARRREEVIRRLGEAGLLGRNDQLDFPPLPLNVGLITSLGSDAYNDVLRTLQDSGYGFSVTVHGARVQGHATEPSVLNALDWFGERAHRFDVLLVCRGGGSRTDLVWFDSEPLGRAVARLPLPVVVGIGHEQDRSVLDAVARSRKTPTAAAALLVQTVRESLERLESTAAEILQRAKGTIGEERERGRERAGRLARAARQRVRHERVLLERRRRGTVTGATALLRAQRHHVARAAAQIPRGAGQQLARQRDMLTRALRTLQRGARRDLTAARDRLARLARDLRPRSLARLSREEERTAQRERRTRLLHPRRVVERGYAILRLDDGTVLTSPDQAPQGRSVRAELRHGAIRLRSEGRDATGRSEET